MLGMSIFPNVILCSSLEKHNQSYDAIRTLMLLNTSSRANQARVIIHNTQLLPKIELSNQKQQTSKEKNAFLASMLRVNTKRMLAKLVHE